ncbi:hypothetical protein [uncultured Algibacter sp.]|uniref:hypothetical protein n=1 Tax=uncultured Algibacter sp. TaxID=298659 RepID=UPI00321786FA
MKLNLNLLKSFILALFLGACSTDDAPTDILENDIRVVVISGTPQVGEELTAFYEVTGFTTLDYETATTAIKWWSAEDASGTNPIIIPNATSRTFTPTANEVEKFIAVEVTVENSSNGSRRSRYTGAINN